MEGSTKESGLMVLQMEKEGSGTLMEILMKVFGRTTKLTVMVFTSMLMELAILDFGKMTFRMEEVKKLGLTVQNLKVITSMVKNMARALIIGLMAQVSVEAGLKIRLMVTVSTIGQMVEGSKVLGKTTICTAQVSTHGQMEENMKVIMLTTKSMVKESTIGQMDEYTTVSGLMANNMDRVFTSMQTVTFAKEFGLKESAQCG